MEAILISQIIKDDVFRYGGYYSFPRLLNLVLTNRSFRVIFSMRLCQIVRDFSAMTRRFFLFPCRTFHLICQQLAGVDLPWSTQIGSGLFIVHGWSLVINPGAIIGRNVTICQGVTIGQKDSIKNGVRKTYYPVIEDEVWIGPNAVIVGGVTVGYGSRVAPGSVVYKSVEKHSIVAGNPAEIVAENSESDVLFAVEFDD